MPICPHCAAPVDELLGPCPTGDGYHGVSQEEYAAFQGDRMLGVAISDRYIVTGVIGHGAIGRVYKGRQLGVDRDVVLKIFKIESLLDDELGYTPGRTLVQAREDAKERFIREARVLGQLTHPNCVTLYDFGVSEDGGLLYIAMEFVAGVLMREAVKRGLRAHAILEIMKQMLSALREAHALRIVHRDLKPENIILSFRKESHEPVVKILDFGIAKLVGRDNSPDQALTSAGMLFGTPAYMSPEQCRGASDEVGPHSDIYAFGCMCFELVTGRLPFEGRSPLQLIVMHQEAPVPPVRLREGLEMPQGIEAFIQKCMAKDPRDRYKDAARALRIVEGLERAWEPRSVQRDGSDLVHSAEIASLRAAPTPEAPAAPPALERADAAAIKTLIAATPKDATPKSAAQPAEPSAEPSAAPGRAVLLVVCALGLALAGCAALFWVLYTRL